MSWVLVQALGWALLHFVWKGALIGVATALSLRLMRDASPQERYALLCLSLVACLGAPLLDVYQYLEIAARASDQVGAPVAIALPVAGEDAPSALQYTLQYALPSLVATWLLGVTVMSCRLAAGILWVRRISRADSAQEDARWQARVSGLAARCGIGRKVRLRVASGLSSPLTVGWWRPLVLVPAGLLTGMPPDLLDALLAHEVAHIRRFDYLINLLQRAVEALLFYHPAVWWLSRRMRIERELVADHLAATLIEDPRRLALALEQLSTLQAADAPDSLVAQWAKGGHLLDRIRRLCEPAERPLNRHAHAPAIAFGLVALCVAAHAFRSVTGPFDGTAGTAPARVTAASAQGADLATGDTLQALLARVESNHVVVVDDSSGKVLFQKRPDDVVPIASLTKLMTAMVVLDTQPDMSRTIRIDEADTRALQHSRTGLPVGARLPLREVLQLALMSSNNSAAYALAHNYPGGLPAFRIAMRAKIAALGLKHTTIDEPTGLSPRNTSTASDVAAMVNAAARYPAIARATTDSSRVVRINGTPVEYRNTNPLVGQKGWDIALSKTGFNSEAGRCLTMRLRSVEKNVTVVLLDADPAAFPARDATNIRRMLLAGKLA
nr:M56 family metallopeptidase [Burkholderia sp. Ac-20353]